MPFMRFLTTLLIILVFCLALVFMYQNRDEMARVRVGSHATEQTPVFFIILGAFLVGVVFTSIIGILEGMKLRMGNERLKRKLKKVQAELDELRNLPLTGPADAEPGSHFPPPDEDSAL